MTFESVAQFPSRINSSYRYKLTMSGDSMSIWLEDRKTKHQWASGDLQLSDFVDSTNAIPQAAMTNYVSCFQNCLESTYSEIKHANSESLDNKTHKNKNERDVNSTCDLKPLDKDTWSLQFVLVLKLFTSVWRPEYAITLKPVKLQPIDILAAQLRDVQEEQKQLRDVQEELEQLRERVARQSCKLRLESTANTSKNQTIKWSVIASVVDGGDDNDARTRFKVDGDGKVMFLKSDNYVVKLALIHVYKYDQYFHCELQRDGVHIETCTSICTSTTTFRFAYVIAMNKGETLTVVNKGQNSVNASSTMKIALTSE